MPQCGGIESFMKNKYKFAVLGGDKRQRVIARELLARGHSVGCFALGDIGFSVSGCETCATVDKAMSGADIAVLPLPVTRDGKNLTSQSDKIELFEIVRLAQKNNTMILGGLLPSDFLEFCSNLNVEAVDYYKSESLQQKNALPSAEGALMIAMEHTDITVYGMRALVTGYGRIGKILAEVLRSLGATVTVGARRDETLCEISMSGLESVKVDSEILSTDAYDVIFNTVPSVIFTENTLKKLKNKPLYIEIASVPGGVDMKAAREIGLEVICAPSLPGKYSPVSAGKYVFETISEILSERRIEI